MIISNVVPQEKLREIQLRVLSEIETYLKTSFGPYGSNSLLKQDKAANKYSKDGHTILKHIKYNGIIEQSIQEDLEDITRHIVKTVGDGTTSAVILTSLIMRRLLENQDIAKLPVFKLVSALKAVIEVIKSNVLENSRECTINDIYSICMIATNGDEEISKNIKGIYEEHGMDVFIDVLASTGEENFLREYDGMTLDSGFADICFINNKNNTSRVRHANVYCFQDPVDTPEMIGFFDTLLVENIMKPYQMQQPDKAIPTVILAPKISRDMSQYMESLAEVLIKGSVDSRPPLLIVTNIYNHETYYDIAKLCGAPMIKKYIDPKVQEIDIQKGIAPTPETVASFCGSCDLVEADSSKTKFIAPAKMYNEDGTQSDTYLNLINYLETELKRSQEQGEDNNVTGNLKRRINSLKANMVDYLIGGISMTDRDAKRDLVEDAVLNCRSAAQHGVGYASNVEGLKASGESMLHFLDDPEDTVEPEYTIAKIIYDAYEEIISYLYSTVPEFNLEDYVSEAYAIDNYSTFVPYNIRTGKRDRNVLTSIQTDVCILDAISKIMTLMLTCSQFIVPQPTFNVYIDVDKV